MSDLPDLFRAVLRGNRRPAKNKIDDQDYATFLMRAVRAWEDRVIENPEMLLANEALLARFKEITAVAIAYNADRYRVDPRRGASMKECARILGITPASGSERYRRGRQIMTTRIEDAKVAKFSEARREREALQTARDAAVVELAAYRGRHTA